MIVLDIAMTEDEKIAAPREHLHYEVVMMRWAFEQIPTVPPSLVRNAFIESFALHARVLYEFLVSKKVKNNPNVLAKYYVKDFKPDGIADASRKIIMLNEQIFHFTKRRTDDDKWVLQWIEGALDEFKSRLKHLKPSYSTDWLAANPASVPVSQDPAQSSHPSVLSSLITTSATT